MATYLDRFTTICNSLVDGTATVGQRTGIANAYIHRMDNEEITALFPLANPPVTRETLTDGQKAALVVNMWIQDTQNIYKRYRIDIEATKARNLALTEPNLL
jgi:hypothetical protein